MNPDLDRTVPSGRPLEDEQLGAIVRSVTDEWRLPPQRLDQPTWRDRVRDGRVGRRSWPVRLGGPAVAAVAATVVLAVAAVWLTTPRGQSGLVGVSPGTSATPSVPSSPGSTPLPKLLRNGALPSVTRVMVRGEGRYRLADLTTGTLGDDALAAFTGPTALVARPGGGWVCICAKWTSIGETGPTGMSFSVVTIDPDGHASGQVGFREIEGTVDPDHPADQQYQLVDARIAVAPDGRTAFLSWIAREGAAGWTAGVDAIDVASGALVSSTPVPGEKPAGFEDRSVTRNAASVSISPAGDRVFLQGFWFVEDPTTSDPPYGIDHWTAAVDGQTLGTVSPVEPPVGDCGELDYGLIDADRYYLVCDAGSDGLAVRRVALDGGSPESTLVPRTEGEFAAGALTAHVGDRLYVWDPVAAVMSRVDLRTGELLQSPVASASDGGPVDALAGLGRRLGRWIAPSALAKILLEPGLVASPDGTRLYAIGVTSTTDPTTRGSTGIYAFDAATLALLGHWQPTADFTSIAISADGRFVYAAALGGVDAAGVGSRNRASVTVFDAADGSVRLIAGELGSSDLWFAGPVLE